MYIVESAEEKAKMLKREIVAVYYAYRDPRTGLFPKIIIACALGYLLCPLDLIPDFIPLLGYADDLVIIPALIVLAVKLIPDEVMSDARRHASDGAVRIRSAWVFPVLFVLIWIATTAAIFHVLRIVIAG